VPAFFELLTGENNYEDLKSDSAMIYRVSHRTPKKKLLTIKISAIYLRTNLVQRLAAQ